MNESILIHLHEKTCGQRDNGRLPYTYFDNTVPVLEAISIVFNYIGTRKQ